MCTFGCDGPYSQKHLQIKFRHTFNVIHIGNKEILYSK